MYFKIIIVFCIVALVTSCNKISPNTSNNEIIKSNAELSFTGDYSIDGCGFFVNINGHKYKPNNESYIDNSYKNSSTPTKIVIEYIVLDKQVESACGDLPYNTKTDGISIVTLKKQ